MSSLIYSVREPFSIRSNTFDDILNFGSDRRNNYPNETKIIAENSGALKRCLKIYNNFLFGQGMTESGDFWKTKINAKGLRVDQLLRRIIDEYKHRGIALHIGYNGNLDPCSIIPFPFETIRLKNNRDLMDYEKYKYITVLKYHPNWCAFNFMRKDIVDFNLYNSDKEVIKRQIELAGGFDKWNGQMFYFGENGEVAYPHNSFHSVVEDCISDIYMKRAKNATTSTNFMASHVIQQPFGFDEIASNIEGDNEGKRKGKELEAEFIKGLEGFQGGENAGKILLIQNKSRDTEGKMIPYLITKLEMQNYDKVFEITEKTVHDNIRDNFLIPEVLSSMGKGFATDEIVNGYNYYNQIIKQDQQVIEEIFMTLFKNWWKPINPSGNYSITPLSYLPTSKAVV